ASYVTWTNLFHSCPLRCVLITSPFRVEGQNSGVPHTIFVSVQPKTQTSLAVRIFRDRLARICTKCIMSRCRIHQPKQSSEPVDQNVKRQGKIFRFPMPATLQCEADLLEKLNVAVERGIVNCCRLILQYLLRSLVPSKQRQHEIAISGCVLNTRPDD